MSNASASSVTPSDDDLIAAISSIRETHPSLGIVKLLGQLKNDQPTWTVSEKRFRKVLQASSGITASVQVDGEDGPGLIAQTGIDDTLNIEELAPKVKVKMFNGGKGKGLVVKGGKENKLEMGEVVWTEEPWVGVPSPELEPLLSNRQMCTQCLSLFPRPNPPLSIACPHCPYAHFCNRLCASKSKTSNGSHPDILCIGSNPAIESVRKYVRESKSRSTEGVLRIVARWRMEREREPDSTAKEYERMVWESMARVNQQTKEAERKEWPYTAENRLAEWHYAHSLLLSALGPTQHDENHKPFQKLIKKIRRSPVSVPLTEEEEERWFSFDSFLELLGLVGLNQEDSGGLYRLHCHLNHSCDPNLQVRNLPKTYTLPSQADLPQPLPGPLEPGVRGTNKLTILARRTISPGEELTISYVNLAMPREERRKLLREQYGFWCSCPKCQKEKVDIESK